MRFGEALDEVLKYGRSMTRACWNGAGVVSVQLPDSLSKMNGAYFYIQLPNGDCSPYVPTQYEMTAHDWKIIDENRDTIHKDERVKH